MLLSTTALTRAPSIFIYGVPSISQTLITSCIRTAYVKKPSSHHAPLTISWRSYASEYMPKDNLNRSSPFIEISSQFNVSLPSSRLFFRVVFCVITLPQKNLDVEAPFIAPQARFCGCLPSGVREGGIRLAVIILDLQYSNYPGYLNVQKASLMQPSSACTRYSGRRMA